MHVELKCELEDGRVESYSMALLLGSRADISSDFTYIGTGIIYSVDDVYYYRRNLFHFYKTKEGRGNR